MSFVSRLTCPYCRTLLNPGAMVCHACGAVRGGRPFSLLLILIAFPLAGFVVMFTAFALIGPAMGMPGILLSFFGTWFGLAVWHGVERSQMHWTLPSVGAVVREGVPEIVRDSAEDKVCPKCAERVKRAASVCRFCGFDFAAPRVIGGESASGGAIIEVSPAATGGSGPSVVMDPPRPDWMTGSEAASAARGNHVVMWSPPHEEDQMPPPPARSEVSMPAVVVLVILGLVVGGAFALRPGETPKAAAPAVAPAPPPVIPGGKIMALPEKERVAEVQRGLALLGFDVGAADGVMGAKTRAAIAQFRSRRGLPAGEVDRNFAAMLEAALADKWVADTLGSSRPR